MVNPYDWCVVNKMVQGSQCTIIWHVDNLKISHKKAEDVTEIINKLNDEYGKASPLNVSRDHKHAYLGMYLDFTEDKSFKVSMIPYVNRILKEAPDDMDGLATTPVADCLFKTHDTSKLNTE